MAKKYYAVKVGKEPGVYETWEECKALVDGFPGAKYKSFSTYEEAFAFAELDKRGQVCPQKLNEEVKEAQKAYAFVDGSFNIATKVYGYGGFLVHDGKKEIVQGSGNEEEMASMRNVAGEVLGSMAAIKKAMELGIKELTIYYDYKGIEEWARGTWKRNKAGTIAYYDFIQSTRGKIELHFQKVKGHSGVEGNEEADSLAKKAVGIV